MRDERGGQKEVETGRKKASWLQTKEKRVFSVFFCQLKYTMLHTYRIGDACGTPMKPFLTL